MPGMLGRTRGGPSAGGSAAGALAGQPLRFEEVYLREFPRVFALAYALSGSRWAAEDIAQDAFVVAHQQWGRIGGYDDPGAWVRRVAANLAVSAVRRRLAEARALVRLAGRRAPSSIDLPAEDGDFWRRCASCRAARPRWWPWWPWRTCRPPRWPARWAARSGPPRRTCRRPAPP